VTKKLDLDIQSYLDTRISGGITDIAKGLQFWLSNVWPDIWFSKSRIRGWRILIYELAAFQISGQIVSSGTILISTYLFHVKAM